MEVDKGDNIDGSTTASESKDKEGNESNAGVSE